MSVIAQTLPISVRLVLSNLRELALLVGDLLVRVRQYVFSCYLLEIHCQCLALLCPVLSVTNLNLILDKIGQLFVADNGFQIKSITK